MTSREFFIETIKDEMPRFERVFHAVPAKRLSYRPHRRSKSAVELLHTFVLDVISLPLLLRTGEVDYEKLIKTRQLRTPAQVARTFQRNLKTAERLLRRMSEKGWGKKARMMWGKKVEWETELGTMAWGLLLDLIHHRGQLSTYIRPMGGKVPSIYGPSGDSK